MGLSVINEKELAEGIVTGISAKLDVMQTRMEGWAHGLLAALVTGHTIRIRVPLGDKVVEATVDLIPKQ